MINEGNIKFCYECAKEIILDKSDWISEQNKEEEKKYYHKICWLKYIRQLEAREMGG